MKHTISLFVLLLLSIHSFGTAQIPDIIIYNGDTLSLFNCPLESFPNRDLFNPKSMFGSRGCFNTACWRNYVATWSIEGNKLYLIRIRNACYQTELRNVSASYTSEVNKDSIGCEYADLKALFPNQYKNGKVMADWVNGELYAPRGNLLYYFHDGFQSIYENELEFSLQNGELFNTKELDNSKTRKSKYMADQKLLQKFFQDNINYSKIPDQNKKAKVYIEIVSTTDEGKIDSVKVIRGSDNIRNMEAVRIVKSIPEWDVLYRHGKKTSMSWTLPIVFGTDQK